MGVLGCSCTLVGWARFKDTGLGYAGRVGGKDEVAYIASLKDDLVFGGREDRAGGRGEPCSTRGHCGLAARPRNPALRRRNTRLFPKAFSKQKFHPPWLRLTPSCAGSSRCARLGLLVHIQHGRPQGSW